MKNTLPTFRPILHDATQPRLYPNELRSFTGFEDFDFGLHLVFSTLILDLFPYLRPCLRPLEFSISKQFQEFHGFRGFRFRSAFEFLHSVEFGFVSTQLLLRCDHSQRIAPGFVIGAVSFLKLLLSDILSLHRS
jgi:hypothetical protein